MAALLCAKDLCKTYVIDKRQNNVLKNVNLEVKEGEMVAIMGPSGSGKSTLLYAISGMDRATSGQVIFEGEDLTKLSEKELAKIRLDEMGFIFQQMYMMKNLTILDNIVLPAAESKKSRESRQEKQERGEQLMRKMGNPSKKIFPENGHRYYLIWQSCRQNVQNDSRSARMKPYRWRRICMNGN